MHDYACNNRAADFLDVNTRGSSEADSECGVNREAICFNYVMRIAKQFVLIIKDLRQNTRRFTNNE